jgi:hypothetical protein
MRTNLQILKTQLLLQLFTIASFTYGKSLSDCDYNKGQI